MHLRARLLGLAGTLAVIPLALFGSAGASHAATTHASTFKSCATAKKGEAACMAVVRTDHMVSASALKPNATPSGYGPSQLQSAYKLPSSTAGSGRTVAIVDAYNDPTAEADLGVYRAQFGLPACTTANGCFKKLNQKGHEKNYPPFNLGWAQESALDLDMASAMCPNCTIYLVEANTNSFKNLGTAVDEAATLGAHVISNSYGGGES